jgi:putative Mn2+ efflux pump MntP
LQGRRHECSIKNLFFKKEVILEKVKSKRSLLVPVWFFSVFIIMGTIKLCKGIVEHDKLHIVMSAAGITLSLIGIIMIAPFFRKEEKHFKS